MADYSMFVPKVHFELIPIKNLVSNQDYQRNLSQQHILQAAEHFNLNQINPVKVSRRGGVNYVFNGQHTIEIVALVSGSRDTPVWCMIYDDLDYQNEADIFANQMKYVKPLKPFEVFVANIEAGNPEQLMIRDLVESYSLEIGSSRNYGVICAVSTLEYILKAWLPRPRPNASPVHRRLGRRDRLSFRQYAESDCQIDRCLRGGAEGRAICGKGRRVVSTRHCANRTGAPSRQLGICGGHAGGI